MSHRFLIDAQLPVRMTRWFEQQGYEAEHVFELGLNTAPDFAIWEYARSHDAVIVSKDADFVKLSINEAAGPRVVWIRLGNLTTPALIATLDKVGQEMIAALDAGERLVELRR